MSGDRDQQSFGYERLNGSLEATVTLQTATRPRKCMIVLLLNKELPILHNVWKLKQNPKTIDRFLKFQLQFI